LPKGRFDSALTLACVSGVALSPSVFPLSASYRKRRLTL
jgi:hypothetical protein